VKKMDIRKIDWAGRHPTSYTAEERRAIVLPVLERAVLDFNGSFDPSMFINVNTKLRFKCQKGHVFLSIPKTVMKGHWCLECYRLERSPRLTAKLKIKNSYQLTEAKEIAIERGGKLLSSEYASKLKWQCKRGHSWFANFADVRHGTWCKECRRLGPLLRIKDIVKEKEGLFEEGDYKNTKSRIEFTCSNGHKWKTSAGQVLLGSWCRKCFNLNDAGKNLVKDRLEDAQKFALERGGELLSEVYSARNKKLKWRCQNGHVWEAAFNDLLKGTWCPTCGKGIRERLCRHYFEQITNHVFLSAKPDWLRNSNGNRMELDGFCEVLSLAFEHQGKQHYEKVDHFNQRQESLEWRLSSDRLKRSICVEKGVTLIEVPYWVENESLPGWISNELQSKRPDIAVCAMPLPVSYLASDELFRLKKIAKSKGGECLSQVYLGVFEKHEFRCGKGHTWMALASAIVSSRGVGTWCPKCKNEVMAKVNRKYSIIDMQRLASKRDGKFLSDEFVNVNTPYQWQCSEGHEWNAAPIDVMKGTWCKVCSVDSRRHSLEMAKELAISRGGRCISDSVDYVNSYSYLHWECRNGHRWWGRYNTTRNRSSWCPECAGKVPKHKEKPNQNG
jgi:hypothetical protein